MLIIDKRPQKPTTFDLTDNTLGEGYGGSAREAYDTNAIVTAIKALKSGYKLTHEGNTIIIHNSKSLCEPLDTEETKRTALFTVNKAQELFKIPLSINFNLPGRSALCSPLEDGGYEIFISHSLLNETWYSGLQSRDSKTNEFITYTCGKEFPDRELGIKVLCAHEIAHALCIQQVGLKEHFINGHDELFFSYWKLAIEKLT